MTQAQRRFTEAQASYRQAYDIYLEFDDRYETADIYHNLGVVAQEQGRFTEAEASYHQALDIYLEFGDRHNASGTATQLGIVLAHLGRHEAAAGILLYAAVSWREETGQWSEGDLRWLNRERALAGAGEFAALVRDNVPRELADELTAAIDEAQDPAEEADSGADGQPGPGDNL